MQMPAGGNFPQLQPGQQPSPEQIRAMQAQIASEAQKAGLTVPQYIERVKAQAFRQHQMQQQQQQMQAQQQGGPRPGGPGGAQPGQQVPIAPGPPKPEGLAVANFLKSQNLKERTCILNQQRKGMFKVKRAIRALHSEAYQKARKKNPLLPEVKDRVTAENTFKLLPMSMLALRVQKQDEQAGHEGHGHAKSTKKRVKGLWTVGIVPQQEASDDFYYAWLYEPRSWKTTLYAVGALIAILAVVFFPVWPYHLRLGVWYLSMGMLGLLGLFFGMAFVRLILFLVTMFATPPGLWLYPNLFEDVGFFDSFRPGWAWHEDDKTIKKRKKEERAAKKARREAKANGKPVPEKGGDEPQITKPVTASTTGSESAPANGNMQAQQRNLSARVEEVEDD